MTIAELHGKISRTGANLHAQMEDLLTSDVFSACKYVQPATLLLPFLRTSVDQDGFSAAEYLSEDIRKVEYRFWPMLERGEPDLLLCLHEWGGEPTAYFSGGQNPAVLRKLNCWLTPINSS